jgi:hypothetical protein
VSVQLARKPGSASNENRAKKEATTEEGAAPATEGEQAQQGGQKKARGGFRGGRGRGRGVRAKVATLYLFAFVLLVC